MKNLSKTIVFFGSGPVAAKSLELLSRHYSIESVITKPRAAHHTGEVPVLAACERLRLPVETVATRSELDALFAKASFKSTGAVLVDFGIIVSQKVIDYFPRGILNSHFSLLPEWRGADPITFSILSGQRQTGVSLMLLTARMDEGPLLAQSPYAIAPDETTVTLTAALIEISDLLLQTVLPLWLSDKSQAVPQEAASVAASKIPSYSRKLTKEDGTIDWHKPAAVLEREVRAFVEWPKSRAMLGGLDLIITKSHTAKNSGRAGQPTMIDKKPAIFCGEHALVIDRLKPAGKQEMSGEAFMAGHRDAFLGH